LNINIDNNDLYTYSYTHFFKDLFFCWHVVMIDVGCLPKPFLFEIFKQGTHSTWTTEKMNWNFSLQGKHRKVKKMGKIQGTLAVQSAYFVFKWIRDRIYPDIIPQHKIWQGIIPEGERRDKIPHNKIKLNINENCILLL